jgi:Ca-activated chloride channel family protein
VILVSDGEDHDEEAMKTAADLAQQGVMVCTVGIGSAEGAQIPDPATQDFKKDAEGNVVVSKLNEEELKAIAEKTNGIYVHFENSANTVDALLGQLSQVEKKTFNDVSLLNFKTYYLWFAAAMFLLLIIEQVMPERKMKIA